MYEYKAKVLRVVDGDTFDLLVDLGFASYTKIRVRAEGYDAPETWRPKSEAELEHGTRATARVRQLIEGKDVMIKSTKLGIYGRWGASIRLINPINGVLDLASIMITEGLVKLKSYPADDQSVIVS